MPDTSSFDLVFRVLREGLLLALLVAAPFLCVSLVVSLVTSVLQAVTQVHDHVVGFVPRLLVTVVALAIAGPYLGTQLVRFAVAVFSSVAVVR